VKCRFIVKGGAGILQRRWRSSNAPMEQQIDWQLEADVKNVLDDGDPVYLTALWDQTSTLFHYTGNPMKERQSLNLATSSAW
jgi:hypothetical protein